MGKKLLVLSLILISYQANAIQFNFVASIFGRAKYEIKNFGTYRA